MVNTIGIFGITQSGKTTLAKELSREMWRKNKRRSLVLDPHTEIWGDQAWVTADEEKFWEAVWKTRGAFVIVEEAAATIRRDRELVPVFTRLRHLNHVLCVIGHNGTDLLPAMRQQIKTLYLFRQPQEAAEIWATSFAEPALMDAQYLGRFEFLHCDLFGKPKRFKLKL